MLLILGLLLVAFGAALVLLMPALWVRERHHQYSRPRAVICPETQREAGVTIDAAHAAATALSGKPEFRLSDCTRWPARVHCGQELRHVDLDDVGHGLRVLVLDALEQA